MFKDLIKLAGLSRWYHHEQHADRSNANKASGKSSFSYDDLKSLRKFAFWLFVISIFLNWGMFGAIMLLAWISMWAISLIF